MTSKPLPPAEEPFGDDTLSRAWSDKPHVIRDFLSKRPQYEQLCSEVSYILRNLLDKNGIEYSAVTSRAKTLNSFLEKTDAQQSRLQELKHRLPALSPQEHAELQDLIASSFDATIARTQSVPLVKS